jgi:hypothetical protein
MRNKETKRTNGNVIDLILLPETSCKKQTNQQTKQKITNGMCRFAGLKCRNT